MESEALRRSLLEYSLIFYTRWTELKLDKHIQLRIVQLRQLSLQLHFVYVSELEKLTKSKSNTAEPEVALLELAGVVVNFLEALRLFKENKLQRCPVLGQPPVHCPAQARCVPKRAPIRNLDEQQQPSPGAKRQKISGPPQLLQDRTRRRKAPPL